MLIVPGAAGEIGVLARHAPLVATLKAGSTRVHVRQGEEVLELATGPGFFTVAEDRAIALVDDAVQAKEIDRERAEEQLEAAQAELAKVDAGESSADRWQLEQRIKHAGNQLSGATGPERPAPPRGSGWPMRPPGLLSLVAAPRGGGAGGRAPSAPPAETGA